MSIHSKMTEIANKIRSLLGISEKLGLDAMATNLDTANTEVTTQEELMNQIIEALDGKSAGGNGSADFDAFIEGREFSVTGNATRVKERAFGSNFLVKGVDLPQVTVVEDYAFSLCGKITNANLPQVISIGTSAFDSCGNLTAINMPNVKSLGDSCFDDCGLKHIDLPNVEYVGEYCFLECKSLETVSLPNAKTIGDKAFERNPQLSMVKLQSVDAIPFRAFMQCRLLTKVEIPKATILRESCFYECDSLTTLDLPKCKQIRSEAFSFTAIDTLILRLLDLCDIDVSAIVHTGIVNSEGMPTGTGFIYVPTLVYENYIADLTAKIVEFATSNGVPMDEATAQYMATMILRKLEDYTVDGTTTGELDESKI